MKDCSSIKRDHPLKNFPSMRTEKVVIRKTREELYSEAYQSPTVPHKL